ncbi:MAG: hypothetical protein U1G07_21250 [Verrucomicrobiota bacterium]
MMPPKVTCNADDCPVNAAGLCTSISSIRIDQAGKCWMAEGGRAGPLLRRRKYTCRACGLEIVQDGQGRWQHVGIVLPHPAAPERPPRK